MDLNPYTGHAVKGWPLVIQSIENILSTPRMTRVFERNFGSDLEKFVDAPTNDAALLQLYTAVASALDEWEPRFQLTNISVSVGAAGRVEMVLTGIHQPNAHLKDYSTAFSETHEVKLANERVDVWRLAA